MNKLHGACLIIALTGPACGTAAQEPAFPLAEDYIYANKSDAYVHAAMQFIKEHPHSPMSPRVLLDLLMVGHMANARGLMEHARGRLLFEFGNSLQAKYVTGTFANAKTLRKLIVKQANERVKGDPETLAKQFTGALVMGHEVFGEKLFDDAEFRLRSAVMARLAGAEQISRLLQPQLKADLNDNKRTAPIITAFEAPGTSFDRLLTLHEHRELPVSRFLEQVLLNRLNADDRKRPEIVKLELESMIDAEEHEQALTLLRKLPEDAANTPQDLMLRARVLFAQGRDSDALATLAHLTERHPVSPWTVTGRAFAERIKNVVANLSEHAKIMEAAVAQLVAENGLLELTAIYSPVPENGDQRTPIRVYMGSEGRLHSFEIAVHRGSALLFGYRTNTAQAAVYAAGEPNIQRFLSPGPVPSGDLEISQEPDGRFEISFNYGLNTEDPDAGSNIADLFKSPFLSTRDGLLKLLEYIARRKGWSPEPVFKTDGAITLAWTGLQTATPVTQQVTLEMTPNGRLQSMQGTIFTVESLRHGRPGTFRLAPPEWPSLPTTTQPELDGPGFMRYIMSLFSLWN